ncbi:MAG: hypothetical protein ACREGI_00650, partial [Candidatus Levyibacteriota bacterium]
MMRKKAKKKQSSYALWIKKKIKLIHLFIALLIIPIAVLSFQYMKTLPQYASVVSGGGDNYILPNCPKGFYTTYPGKACEDIVTVNQYRCIDGVLQFRVQFDPLNLASLKINPKLYQYTIYYAGEYSYSVKGQGKTIFQYPPVNHEYYARYTASSLSYLWNDSYSRSMASGGLHALTSTYKGSLSKNQTANLDEVIAGISYKPATSGLTMKVFSASDCR